MEDYESKYELSIQSLSEKNRQIETQKMELADKNSVLMEILTKKDQDLLTINQELLRKNNELMQFSFAISHNVRGPVATILGLMGLIDRKPSQQELNVLLNYLSTSVHSLDGILKGLNQIIDTKDDTFNTREQVDLLAEIVRIQGFLEPVLKQNDISIRYKLDINNLFTVKAYVQNILGQLIANGIQFRATERKSEIRIMTTRENGAVLLRVEDNGLGLDLRRYKSDLFRPFKRFHPTSSGKGIGLYLVKLQVEKLHGTIDVLSKPQKGFSITIRLSDEIVNLN
jgi:light-regulated signal transduction histidine kinase (bacteriophytochrome)